MSARRSDPARAAGPPARAARTGEPARADRVRGGGRPVEELERQREDLETALRELNKLIADTDRQIRESFEQMFEAAARNFEQVAAGCSRRPRSAAARDRARGARAGLRGRPAPGEENPDRVGRRRRRRRNPGADGRPEEDLLGVEIEITPAGKDMKRLSLLSGGEKSMTALAFLFAVFLARPCPFYILDEVEAALDDLNIDRFLELLRTYSRHAQFIVVTHQKRTMEAADSLYGVSMGADGISKVISRRLPAQEEARNLAARWHASGETCSSSTASRATDPSPRLKPRSGAGGCSAAAREPAQDPSGARHRDPGDPVRGSERGDVGAARGGADLRRRRRRHDGEGGRPTRT